MSHSGESALYLACDSGSLPSIQLMLDQGLDIEQKRNDGMTPLLSAALGGRTDAVEFLMSKGTNFILVYFDDCSTRLPFAFDKFIPASIDFRIQSIPVSATINVHGVLFPNLLSLLKKKQKKQGNKNNNNINNSPTEKTEPGSTLGAP